MFFSLCENLQKILVPTYVLNGRQPDQVSWSLRQLFGIGAGPACPLATTSIIYIDTTGRKNTLPPVQCSKKSYCSDL